jgi:hypothetical protein
MFIKYFRDGRKECQDLFKTLEKITGDFPDVAVRTFETNEGNVSIFTEDPDVKTTPTLKFYSEKEGLIKILEGFPTEEEIISIIE